MNKVVFSNINKIIERDSKTTTYKFALLRGTIDLIHDNSPYISFIEGRVLFPLGLLIEKWILYYYPILESSTDIPQINGDTNLAFANQMKVIISYYSRIGGFSVFYNDLKNKGIPDSITSEFLQLTQKLKDTITKMPMKYIGWSISNTHYSIFNFDPLKYKGTTDKIDLENLIGNFGTFSIPLEYYEAFQVLGSFISGQESILLKWAQFSVNASGKNLSIERVIHEVLKGPITERDVEESKKIYRSILKEHGKVFCVWTGKALSNYDVDHMIPFSVWKNNDFWNLLPSQSTINNQKRQKIPSAELIEKQKDLIIHYWTLVNDKQSQRFQKEIQVALLGNSPFLNWEATAIKQLKNSCDYLITNRGYEEWKI